MEPMEGNSLMQLLNNRIFWVCVMAWFVAQAAKVVLTLAVERRLDFRRFSDWAVCPAPIRPW